MKLNLARPKKHLRPCAGNRDEAISLIATGLEQTEGQFARMTDHHVTTAYQDLREQNVSALGIGLGFLFFNSLGSAVNRVLEGKQEGWQQMRSAFARMYWGCEVRQHNRTKEHIPFENPTQCESEQVLFHALALAAGANEIASWCGHFLHNLFYWGGVNSGIGSINEDFMEFYWRLLIAQVEKRWVPKEKLKDDLGHFRPLLETAGDPKAFELALVQYCDFRLSRAFQFDSPDSSRPRKSSDGMYLFEQQWVAVFPLELLALQAIYQSTTGKRLSLEADHPLLHTPLMKVPAMVPLVEDELSIEIRKFGESIFCSQWSPLKPVRLLD